jgi:hypothetical protein
MNVGTRLPALLSWRRHEFNKALASTASGSFALTLTALECGQLEWRETLFRPRAVPGQSMVTAVHDPTNGLKECLLQGAPAGLRPRGVRGLADRARDRES